MTLPATSSSHQTFSTIIICNNELKFIGIIMAMLCTRLVHTHTHARTSNWTKLIFVCREDKRKKNPFASTNELKHISISAAWWHGSWHMLTKTIHLYFNTRRGRGHQAVCAYGFFFFLIFIQDAGCAQMNGMGIGMSRKKLHLTIIGLPLLFFPGRNVQCSMFNIEKCAIKTRLWKKRVSVWCTKCCSYCLFTCNFGKQNEKINSFK